jgi:hypothetical protein
MMLGIRYGLSGVKTLRGLSRFLAGACLFYTTLVGATSSHAQELVRSAAGKLPIQSFKNPEANFHLGPLQETLTGSADVEYTDNINLTDTNKISDFSFHQMLSLNTIWTISQLNQFQFNFGGQLIENFYGNGKSEVNFAISPDSLIQFQFAVSNFLIRLYDQFSYVQNPASNPTITNTANLNNLTNTIGAAVDADLGLAVLSLSSDFTYNNQSGTTAGGQTNATNTGSRNSFRVGSGLTFAFSPTIFYGIDASVTRSTGSDSANVNSLSVGPFVRGKLGKNLDFDLSGGINVVDTKPAIPLGYFLSAVLRYQIDRHWQVILTGSRDLAFSTSTSLNEANNIRLDTQLSLRPSLTLTGSVFIDFGQSLTNTTTVNNPVVTQQGTFTQFPFQGNFTQLGFEGKLNWQLRKHWSSALKYDFTRLEASTAADGYIQNVVALSIEYAF